MLQPPLYSVDISLVMPQPPLYSVDISQLLLQPPLCGVDISGLLTVNNYSPACQSRDLQFLILICYGGAEEPLWHG